METEKSLGRVIVPFFLDRRNMEIYNIKDSYIQFLRQYDTNVAENKKETRPYVGVLLKIGDIKYYAPFTSPKEKHKKMKNSKDFRKIAGGTLGAINFNNMIPVPDQALILKDINNEPDQRYKRLLQNQYKEIKADWVHIQKTATNLRELVLRSEDKLNNFEKQVKFRCCNLFLLESIYMTYDK